MRWEFDPGIPTHDFFEGRPLSDLWNLHEAVENFVFMLEQVDFLTWEAIGGTDALLRSVLPRTERDGPLTIHRAARVPNPVGRITGDYSRGFRPNERFPSSTGRRISVQ